MRQKREGKPEPAIKAVVLKDDGTDSEKIIIINVSDVEDMGDGMPNKPLPIPGAKPKAAPKK